MKIKVWGCRGSICSPGIATQRYGGNTTCLEIIASQEKTIIVDAGSGLRNLGKTLIRENRASKVFFVFTTHIGGIPPIKMRLIWQLKQESDDWDCFTTILTETTPVWISKLRNAKGRLKMQEALWIASLWLKAWKSSFNYWRSCSLIPRLLHSMGCWTYHPVPISQRMLL